MSIRERKNAWAQKRRSEVSSIPKNIHGWVDAAKYKPPKSLYFELLMIKDDTGRIQQGWWSGTTWDHIKRGISSNFVAWRLLNSDERVIKYKDSGKD